MRMRNESEKYKTDFVFWLSWSTEYDRWESGTIGATEVGMILVALAFDLRNPRRRDMKWSSKREVTLRHVHTKDWAQSEFLFASCWVRIGAFHSSSGCVLFSKNLIILIGQHWFLRFSSNGSSPKIIPRQLLELALIAQYHQLPLIESFKTWPFWVWSFDFWRRRWRWWWCRNFAGEVFGQSSGMWSPGGRHGVVFCASRLRELQGQTTWNNRYQQVLRFESGRFELISYYFGDAGESE